MQESPLGLEQDALAQWCENLPVFPLSGLVLLPGQLLPLHIFEPRYQALLRHCMTHQPIFAIATPKADAPPSEEEPPLHRMMGVARVVRYQPLGDGRSDILLQGIGRVRMEREHTTDHPFRVVHASVCVEGDTGGAMMRRGLRQLLLQLASAAPRATDEVERLLKLPPEHLVNALANQLLDNPGDRLAYLKLNRYAKRVEVVESHLARYFESQHPFGEG